MAGVYNSKKRNKKKYYSHFSKEAKQGYLQPGLKGILITCNQREKDCVKEAYDLLNEYADILYGPEFKAPDEKRFKMSVEDQLDAEMRMLKTNKKDRRFLQVCTNVKNIIFIRATVPDTTKLVTDIFEDVKTTGRRKARNILKMIPVQGTCKCSAEEFKNCVIDVANTQFPNSDTCQSLTYKIHCKVRNNSSVKSFNFISYCQTAIKDTRPFWKPCLFEPEVIICVYVLQNMCCLSILRNYNIFKKYNLAELTSSTIIQRGTCTTNTASTQTHGFGSISNFGNLVDELEPGEQVDSGINTDDGNKGDTSFTLPATIVHRNNSPEEQTSQVEPLSVCDDMNVSDSINDKEEKYTEQAIQGDTITHKNKSGEENLVKEPCPLNTGINDDSNECDITIFSGL